MSDAVTIVGFGPSADAVVPFAKGDVWVLAHDPQYTANATRLFEMHDMDLVVKYRRNFKERLATLAEFIPVYTQKPEPWLTHNRVYPLTEVTDMLGMDYFQCSIAYMVALAILEEFDEMTIAGVDLVSSKYAAQRPNLEWLIGHAQARGIDVHIPDWSEILRYDPRGGLPGDRRGTLEYPTRYGYAPTNIVKGEYHKELPGMEDQHAAVKEAMNVEVLP